MIAICSLILNNQLRPNKTTSLSQKFKRIAFKIGFSSHYLFIYFLGNMFAHLNFFFQSLEKERKIWLQSSQKNVGKKCGKCTSSPRYWYTSIGQY